MKSLELTLSLDETNLILASLGKLSYETSFKLIEKIQAQANPQLIVAKAEAAEALVEG